MRASGMFAPNTPLSVGEVELDDELISRRYGLDEADEAFRDLAAGELARGVIVF